MSRSHDPQLITHNQQPKKLLLIGATTGYQTRVFAGAAEKLGYTLQLATDRCHILDDPWGDHALPLRFEDPEGAAQAIAASEPIDGIVAVGDRPAYIAALAAAPPRAAAEAAHYPCVLKPLGLSASRGVIRANNPREFAAAFHRIAALLD